MGAIQQSINSMIGSTVQAAGIAKGANAMEKQAQAAEKEAQAAEKAQQVEFNKAALEQEVDTEPLQKEYKEIQKPVKSAERLVEAAEEKQEAASEAFNDAYMRGKEDDNWFPPRAPATEKELEDLAGKARIAKEHLNEVQDMLKSQRKAFNERKAQLQKRLDLINAKANIYGLKPTTLKGGKK